MLSVTTFKNLPDQLLNDLLFLRGQRDALASELSNALSSEEDDGLIEQIITYQGATSALHRLERSFNRHWVNPAYGSYNNTGIDPLHALYLISLRIARLERERCHVEIYNSELRAA